MRARVAGRPRQPDRRRRRPAPELDELELGRSAVPQPRPARQHAVPGPLRDPRRVPERQRDEAGRRTGRDHGGSACSRSRGLWIAGIEIIDFTIESDERLVTTAPRYSRDAIGTSGVMLGGPGTMRTEGRSTSGPGWARPLPRTRTVRSTRRAAFVCSERLLLDEVDEHVVAEGLGRGEERPAPVHLGELLDERPQVAGGVEHERVDADALAGAARHLAQRRVDRLAARAGS